ncbi:MAG: hypothetical protein ACWA5R_08470 [bacterium]
MEMYIRLTVLLLLLFGCFEASAQTYDLDVSPVAPADSNIHLLPGEQVDVTWQLRNNQATSINNLVLYMGVSFGGDGYIIQSLTTEVCGQLVLIPDQFGVDYSVEVLVDVPPNDEVFCTFRIFRLADSIHDISLTFGQLCGLNFCHWSSISFGYLPDFSVKTQQQSLVRPGDTEAIVRVTFDNPSPFPVSAAVGACLADGPLPYQMVEPQGASDACITGSVGGLLCFGPVWGIQFGVVDPETTVSCQVKLEFDQPIISEVSNQMILLADAAPEPLVYYALRDPDYDNNFISLGAVVTPYAVPLSRTTLLLMVVLLVFFARLNMRNL